MKLNDARWLPALGMVLALVACAATTRLEAQWFDAQFQGQSLHGARVLVMCESPDLTLKHLCEDQMMLRLAEVGASPVRAPEARQGTSEDPVAAAHMAGAQSIFSTWIVPRGAVASPGTWFNFGIGGFGGGGGGSFGGVGVGATVPVGAGNVQIGFEANGSVADVGTGKLMWTGRASAPPSSDLNRQIEDLTRTVVNGALQAGFH